MAELFRIPINRTSDRWELSGGVLFCYDVELRCNVTLPPRCEVWDADLVAHTHPAADRFECFVDRGLRYANCGWSKYARVHVRYCSGAWGSWTFSQDAIAHMLKRHKLKLGDKFYVQIEY